MPRCCSQLALPSGVSTLDRPVPFPEKGENRTAGGSAGDSVTGVDEYRAAGGEVGVRGWRPSQLNARIAQTRGSWALEHAQHRSKGPRAAPLEWSAPFEACLQESLALLGTLA